MLPIDNERVQNLKTQYPNYTIKAPWKSDSWQTSRYIQLLIPGMDEDVHYEYLIDSNWEGRVELHFEGDWARSRIFNSREANYWISSENSSRF